MSHAINLSPIELTSAIFLFLFGNIIFMSLFGIVCARIASNKGRNALGWFFIGFFLNFIGLVFVIVLPNLKEQQAKFKKIDLEIRILKEQLLYEQHRNGNYNPDSEISLHDHDKPSEADTNLSEITDSSTEIEKKDIDTGIIVCPNCGKTNTADSQYCFWCSVYIGTSNAK